MQSRHALAQPDLAPGDKPALHCSFNGGAWGDESLTRDPTTSLFKPRPGMAAGAYEGLLRVARGDGGGEYWLPIPLACLRAGSADSSNNRCWTILPAA